MAFWIIFSLIFLPFFANASVIINEIAWMGTLTSSADEWLELKNEADNKMDLNGWRLEWKGGEYGITFDNVKCPSGTIISAGGHFLLERTDDNSMPGVQADCIYTGALRNEGEDIVLKDSGGNTVNEVKSAGGWPAGDNGSKDTMQKQGSGWITGSPTPRAENSGTALPPPPSPSSTPLSSVPSSQSSSGGFVIEKTISAYAGEDKKAVAGSGVEFLGYAKGLNGEPLENARFWWNFGDGGTKEGRAVSHIFSIPGKYTVGLHVSSGYYSASDYLLVEVLSNLVKIESVVEGKEGYVKIKNPSGAEMDLGGWFLSDGKTNFFIPPQTKIGASAEAFFPNEITGLLAGGGTKSVYLKFPNGIVAAESGKEKSGIMVKPKGIPIVSTDVALEKKEVDVAVVAETVPPQETPVKSEEKTATVSTGSFLGGKMFFALAFILALFSSAAFILSKRFVS